jgi:uncharacterized membrane-anchored protein
MNKRTAFIVGVFLELLAVFGLFTHNLTFMATGDAIRLKTEPVDPWSLTRGQYVTLSYEIGGDFPVSDDNFNDYDTPVYVVIKKNAEGLAERVRFSTTKPELAAGEQCILGRLQWDRVWFPDIAQYFVEEGQGIELEDAARYRRLYVDVVTNDDCHALITGVEIGEETDNPFDMMDDSLVMPPETAPVR